MKIFMITSEHGSIYGLDEKNKILRWNPNVENWEIYSHKTRPAPTERPSNGMLRYSPAPNEY